jgi:hypothetical protein
MPLFWQNKVLLAKIETTYGVDATPTGAANAILASDVKLSPMEGQDVSRELDSRPWMGASETIPVGIFAKISFKVEAKGSGTAGTAPAFGPLLRSCAMAEVVSAGVSVTYNRVSPSAAAPGASATIYLNIDGTLHAIIGARGTCVYRVSAAGVPYFEFEFSGLFVQPSAVALPTPTFGTQLSQMPQAASSANTPTFTLGGVSLVLRELSLDWGSEITPRFLIRSESILITGMSEKIALKVEAVPLATFNPFVAAAAGTLQALSLVHGTGAGKIVTLSVPNFLLQRPSDLGATDKIVEWGLPGIPKSTAAGDQFTLSFT